MMKPDNTSQQATVLIVDDSPTYIQALAKLLKETTVSKHYSGRVSDIARKRCKACQRITGGGRAR